MTWVITCLFITWAALFAYCCSLFIKERAIARRLAALEADNV